VIVNISDKHGAFIWTPEKTASNLASMVFNHFDFYAYDVIKKEKVYDEIKHFHSNCFFDGHENYDFILTCRNPYDRFLSMNGYSSMSREKFRDQLEFYFSEKMHHVQTMKNLLKRKPDYIVRTENMLGDYLKIPFIRNSQLCKSGELENLVKTKVNSSNSEKSKEILDSHLADLIYYNNITFFDLCGYEKDSWKY
jgi:hypothetical protein